MGVRVGVVMDPIEAINPYKDTTLALLAEAQRRHWQVYYITCANMVAEQDRVLADTHELSVDLNAINTNKWYTLDKPACIDCSELDVILMRHDPPFDMQYIYITYLLERVQAQGVLVVNDPQGVRDCSEKLVLTRFAHCAAPFVVTRSKAKARAFLQQYSHCVFKPLDGLGGQSVFQARDGDANVNVILETLIGDEQRFIMAQQFIPAICKGDKRIILVDGEPIPYGLARIPSKNDSRGNLAAGATGRGFALSERDHWLCQQIGPTLKKRGLMFVGLDVIGDYITEINVTSPTCVREIDAAFNCDIPRQLMDVISQKIGER